MAQIDAKLTTGLAGLDKVFKGLIPGDNIVWRVGSIDDYIPFVKPYCTEAMKRGHKLIYFRFAKHEPLVDADCGAEIHQLHPEAGFEAFLDEVHKVIENTGHGGFYVFDCLSELTVDWYSDQMLGNFFMLTCPYLLDVEAIACFSLLRNYHSAGAISAITNTTQILVDVYRHKGGLYIHPLKVQQRYSPTMYMLHAWKGEEFIPVAQSATIAEIMTSSPWRQLTSAGSGIGIWRRALMQAERALVAAVKGEAGFETADEHFQRLVKMMVSRDERVFGLVYKYMMLQDVIEIGKRMIGTGLIGGKSVGMLLARAILKRMDKCWCERLEPHDSFFIGSDVFYTFLVRNGIWWARQKQRHPESFLEGSERARQSIIRGTFPEDIEKQFVDLLDYFGQSPIIVRSSSLLEDNFGNAFAGKYESVFCANQGSRDKRLEDFKSAVLTIYASTMSEKALKYRSRRGLLDRDEQMALLVQRVSGSVHGSLFYPQIAGVGLSYNPYRWSEDIDPQAGMLRLVFGLGTRAVDRSDDDYTRVIALNAPNKRPEASSDDVRQFAQRKVDILDLEANQLLSRPFGEVAKLSPNLPVDIFASHAQHETATLKGGQDTIPSVLTFENLLSKTTFIRDMREMLGIIHEAYDYPVDVEFTANFLDENSCKINLVQCRPLQVAGVGTVVSPPDNIKKDSLVLEARGAVIGQSRILSIDRIIHVVTSPYSRLSVSDRYTVARLIGKLTHLNGKDASKSTMLMGPGRWGTTTPSLGVPAAFSEINTVSALCEIVSMRDDLIPDVSLGTHYFSDLVEMDILYLALFPNREGNFLNESLLAASPNRLSELLPDVKKWCEVVQVIDICNLPGRGEVILNADTLKQKVLCYIKNDE